MDAAFDATQRREMESFRDFDREAWREVHAADTVLILPTGLVVAGCDEVVDALAAHFDECQARWSWTELSRRVQPGQAGHILYATVYEVPATGRRVRALTGVTYAFDAGRWLVVADQSTLLP